MHLLTKPLAQLPAHRLLEITAGEMDCPDKLTEISDRPKGA